MTRPLGEAVKSCARECGLAYVVRAVDQNPVPTASVTEGPNVIEVIPVV
jgi:hypothetical protein